jgi:hypothetical protein
MFLHQVPLCFHLVGYIVLVAPWVAYSVKSFPFRTVSMKRAGNVTMPGRFIWLVRSPTRKPSHRRVIDVVFGEYLFELGPYSIHVEEEGERTPGSGAV